MQNEESKQSQSMSFPPEWQGYSPGQYSMEDNLEFDFFDFGSHRHPHMATAPISEPPSLSQDTTTMSTENSKGMNVQSSMSTPNPTPVKGRRVRTGCLTCRERHLKCDEAVPDCMNCRKRGRECKRGVRLNFLEINLHSPAAIPPPEDWAGMDSHINHRFCADPNSSRVSRRITRDCFRISRWSWSLRTIFSRTR